MRTSSMDLRSLENTAWAKEFKIDSPVSYAEALQLASQPNLLVDIERETSVLGHPCWAILVADQTPPFWMDNQPTRKAADALCREMGWRIRR